MFSKLERFDRINVTKLEIEGFKGYRNEREFKLGDITKVMADNHQGKTSIGEAITWAFLGSNLWGNNKADSLLMNNSSKRMIVTVYFSDGEKDNKLIRNRSGNITRIILNNKEIRQVDLNYLVGNKDVFLSIFNPMYFHSMNQKQGRDFIVSILPEVATEDVIEKMANFELEHIKNDINYIHNNPNEYIKEKRREIKEIEEDIIYIEGILSTLEPHNLEEPVDDGLLMNLGGNIKKDKKELEKLILEKHSIEKEKIRLESKVFKKVDTTDLYKKKLELENGLELIKSQKHEIDKTIQERVIKLEVEVKNLREEYKNKNNLTLGEGDSCPTCKTIMSKHHLAVLEGDKEDELDKIAALGKEKTRELKNLINKEKEMEEKFNTFKRNRINEFENKTKEIANEIEDIKRKDEEDNQVFELERGKQLKILNDKIESQEKCIETIKDILKEKEDKYYKLKSEKEIREKKLIESEKETAKLQRKLAEHNNSIKIYNSQIRIAQSYTNLKVEMLSSIIHENLKDVEIVLQKIIKSTGELKDVFEIRYKGNDFKVLSTSEQIKAGLEISNLVINQTGLCYPIFIDNGESITNYNIENNVQVIETKVVEGKELEINIEDNIKIAI